MRRATEPLGVALLARARNAVAAALRAGLVDAPDHPELDLAGATFVTLFTAGELHGCVGSLYPTRRLGEDVHANASAAAFNDPRFEPLTLHEFTVTRFEVSLLGPALPLEVKSEADAVAQIGRFRDGVTLAWGDARATLLPQVWDALPDPQQFLLALKRKAGLAPGFWARDVRLERYSVIHFDEAAAPIAGCR
jgi:hypothetical protein